MPVLVSTDALSVEEFPLDLPTRAYLGESGIVLGDGSFTDDAGCTWKWAPTNAWGNKPAPREQTGDRPFAHGQWDATSYHGPRTLTIPGSVRAPSHAAIHDAEQRLRDAVGIAPFVLRVTEPGYDSYATVRQIGELLWTEDGTPGTPHATFNIGLLAPDPLIYSSLMRTFRLRFPTISGGLTWPATWPATWATSGDRGSSELANPGRLPVGLQLQVDGPATTVAIAFPGLGVGMNLSAASGVPVLTGGQWLSIDTATRQVLLNGQAGRRSWLFGDWLTLPASSITEIAINGTGTTAASGVSGSYRTARL